MSGVELTIDKVFEDFMILSGDGSWWAMRHKSPAFCFRHESKQAAIRQAKRAMKLYNQGTLRK